MKTQRQLIFYKHYFLDFYVSQNKKVQEKIEYVFNILRTVDKVPTKFLEHLSGTEDLYEIRVEYNSNIYRICCCFDKGNIIILFNGFQKKSAKTPKEEIELAYRLMKEYVSGKNK